MLSDVPDAHADAAALREFVGNTLAVALGGKKKDRLLAIQTLGAITLALTFPARCDIKVYVGEAMVEGDKPGPRCDRCFAPMPCGDHPDEIKREPLQPSDPAPSAAPAGFYSRETDHHPSCVINEDAHGH